MNLAANLPIIVIIIPLLAAIIIPLAARLERSFAWIIAVAATFFSFLSALFLLKAVMDTGRISYWLGGWEPPWGIEYAVDYLNGFVLVVVTFIAFVVAVYSKRSVYREIAHDKIPVFYAVYMLFVAGLTGVSITGDIFNLYVFIEITSLSVYTLIAMGRRRDALIASFNYLILGTIAGTFILIGVGYLYMVTGTLNMADLSELLPGLYSSTAVRTAFAFFTVGLSLKIALFPLHIWLPKAYTEAPSAVSAVVAATATKVGAYVLIRIMFTVFSVEFSLKVLPVTTILLILSSIAIIMGSVLAIAQTNLKRMLAYSSVGQIGYNKPPISNYRCLHKCLLQSVKVPRFIWSDKGTNADKPVSMYKLANSNSFTARSDRNKPSLLFDLQPLPVCSNNLEPVLNTSTMNKEVEPFQPPPAPRKSNEWVNPDEVLDAPPPPPPRKKNEWINPDEL